MPNESKMLGNTSMTNIKINCWWFVGPYLSWMWLPLTHCTSPMDYISHHALHSHIPVHHYTIHSLVLIVSPHLHLIHSHTFKQHSHMHSLRSLVLPWLTFWAFSLFSPGLPIYSDRLLPAFWLGVDRYVFFRADTDTDYYRSSRPITDILNRYTCLV